MINKVSNNMYSEDRKSLQPAWGVVVNERLNPIRRKTFWALNILCGMLMTVVSAMLAARYGEVYSNAVSVPGLAIGKPMPAADSWVAVVPGGWPSRPQIEVACKGLGIAYRELSALDASSGRQYEVTIYESGWPALALSSIQRTERRLDGKAVWQSPGDAIYLDSSYGKLLSFMRDGVDAQRRIPLRPLIGNILLNVAFFGSVSVALITCARGTRLIKRFMGGRCCSCGYSLDGQVSRTCPECGTKHQGDS